MVCRVFCPATQCLKLIPEIATLAAYAALNSSIFKPSALSRSIIACRAYSELVVSFLSAAAAIAAGRFSGVRMRKYPENRILRLSLIDRAFRGFKSPLHRIISQWPHKIAGHLIEARQFLTYLPLLSCAAFKLLAPIL
jgi:hypothetical protein